MAIDLSTLKAKKTPKPPRLLVHGGEGIGKSTFFSKAPNPLFFQTEDGLDELTVAKYPEDGPAQSLDQLLELTYLLHNEEHDFDAFIIDSADWLETIVNEAVCKDHNVDSIEDFGYGKGYVLAAATFKDVLNRLNRLRIAKSMVIGFTAHSQVKRYDDPTMDPYDRYLLKMHQRSASLLKEWCDLIGFASQRTMLKSTDVGFNKKVKRGVTTGERLLHVEEQPAFEAKNRYGLTGALPLEWGAVIAAITHSLTED